MAIYTYECMNNAGEMVKGKINAEEEATAVIQLRNMGYSVLDLSELRPSFTDRILQMGKGVSDSELCLFSRQLSTMLAAGIPLTRALYTLGQQLDNQFFKDTLEEITRSVEGGMSLTEALELYPGIFSPLYLSMVRAGEIRGNMDVALLRLADQLQKDKALKDSVKSATFYPRIVLVFAALLLVGMLVFLVPVFAGFFPEGAAIPLPTKIIIGISDSMRGYWYIWLSVTAMIVIGLIYIMQKPFIKNIWEKTKFKIPAFGTLIHKSVMARFCRTLSTLLEGGIPIVQALEYAGPTSGSYTVSDIVSEVGLKIQEGSSISEELTGSKVFPPMVVQMISVGEETGELPSMVAKIAEFYEEEVAVLTKGLAAMIEPIMLVTVGIVVGLMIIALYLPIFTSITSAGM